MFGIDYKKIPLGRALLIWLGSALLIGAVLYFHFGFPLTPLIGGAVLAFVLTLWRHYQARS